MTREELKQAAIDYLTKALKGEPEITNPHVLQAAVSVLVALEEPKSLDGSS